MEQVEIIETIGDKTFRIAKICGSIYVECKNRRSSFGQYITVHTSHPDSGSNTVSMNTYGRYSIDICQFMWVMNKITELLSEDQP